MKTPPGNPSLWLQRRRQPPSEDVCLRILSDLRPVFLGSASRHDALESRLIVYEQEARANVNDMQVGMSDGHGTQTLRSTYGTTIREPEYEIIPNGTQLVNGKNGISGIFNLSVHGENWTSKDSFDHAANDAAFALLGLFDKRCATLRCPPLLPSETFRLGHTFSSSTGLPPNIQHRWHLFLHLLGWQQLSDCPIRAKRFLRKNGNSIEFGNTEELQSKMLSGWMREQYGEAESKGKLRFFASDLFQDINMASVYAIDLILSENLTEPPVDYTALIHELDSIRPGNDDARKYHDTVFEILKALFRPTLQDIGKEVATDEGRARIDIVFDNRAEDGYFYDLMIRYQLKCPMIFFECKNYSSDVNNQEFNQIYSRLDDQRGRVGFLVCRSISNTEQVMARCKDVYNNKRSHILVLDDADLKDMLARKTAKDDAGMWNILRNKWRIVVLNKKA